MAEKRGMNGRVREIYTSVFKWSHLERSGSVGLFPAEVDLAGDGQTHKEPVAKAVVVDELEDVFHCQVDQRHDTLDRGGKREWRQWVKTKTDVNEYTLRYR